ncbi:MAG: hypothetical protein DI546_08050 [Rhizobium sp.]|nr:MAG: hypothetical protein DI546_08050 [Rhizobium sp.]
MREAGFRNGKAKPRISGVRHNGDTAVFPCFPGWDGERVYIAGGSLARLVHPHSVTPDQIRGPARSSP